MLWAWCLIYCFFAQTLPPHHHRRRHHCHLSSSPIHLSFIIHSTTHPLIHSSIHPFIHSSIHQLIHHPSSIIRSSIIHHRHPHRHHCHHPSPHQDALLVRRRVKITIVCVWCAIQVFFLYNNLYVTPQQGWCVRVGAFFFSCDVVMPCCGRCLCWRCYCYW
jgi:hypothetical protein